MGTYMHTYIHTYIHTCIHTWEEVASHSRTGRYSGEDRGSGKGRRCSRYLCLLCLRHKLSFLATFRAPMTRRRSPACSQKHISYYSLHLTTHYTRHLFFLKKEKKKKKLMM